MKNNYPCISPTTEIASNHLVETLASYLEARYEVYKLDYSFSSELEVYASVRAFWYSPNITIFFDQADNYFKLEVFDGDEAFTVSLGVNNHRSVGFHILDSAIGHVPEHLNLLGEN